MPDHLLIHRRTADLGGGFIVGRVLPHRARRMVGPFIFLDHMGPLDLTPGIPRKLDVRPPPHIGLSTVTYLYSGAITHRDGLGSEQEIRPGQVNWMTAGSGITHSECLEYVRAHGTHMGGIQTRVALPDEAEETGPAFHPCAGADQLPEFDEDRVRGRLVAGAVDGLHSRVRTHSPLFYLHWTLQPGARRSLGTEHPERDVCVAEGEVEIASQTLQAGQMRVLGTREAVQITARTRSTAMLLGGEPAGQRYIDWNFVSSSRKRLEQAKEDWRQQRMKLPVGDDQEFIPLPE